MNTTKRIIKKLAKNVQAISPVIATLMLVLIAVASAGAFYVWQSGWQAQQTKNVQNTEIVTGTTLTIAGSTTVYPFSVEAASLFEQRYNNAYIVNIQQGGSDAGVKSVGTGLVQIGAASRTLTQTELSTYPDLNSDGVKDKDQSDLIQTKVGYGAVTLIISNNNPNYNLAIAHTWTRAQIQAIYYANSNPRPTIPLNVQTNITALNNTANAIITWHDVLGGTATNDKIKIYDRTDASGTEETFVKSMMGTGQSVQLETLNVVANHYVGNAGVVNAVASDKTGLGFADYGFAKPSTSGVRMLPFEQAGTTPDAKYSDPYNSGFEGAIKTFETSSNYYRGSRALYYITIGAPTGLAKLFIDFVRQPGNNQEICTASGCVTFY